MDNADDWGIFKIVKCIGEVYSDELMALAWKVPLIPLLEDELFKRLPLYGPLNICSYSQFLDDHKKSFRELFPIKFPNVVAVKEFDFTHFIAQGAFGKVYLVKRKVGESRYAAKVISKALVIKQNCVKQLLNEKRVLQSLDCPFCVRLEFFSQTSVHLYLFLPFISGGCVFTHLRKFGRFKENISKFYAAQIVLAFQLMHHCDIVYRDLKPENLLLDHLGFLKITDFGFAKVVATRTYTFLGTIEYIAPEIIVGRGYGKTVDWWTLGVLIYELTAGQVPFHTKEDIKTLKKILEVEYIIPRYFSPELKDLVQRLLQRDVSRRAGCLWQGAEDVKSHPWFRGIDWLQLLNRKVVPPFIPDHTINFSKTKSPHVSEVSKVSITNIHDIDQYFKDF